MGPFTVLHDAACGYKAKQEGQRNENHQITTGVLINHLLFFDLLAAEERTEVIVEVTFLVSELGNIAPLGVE